MEDGFCRFCWAETLVFIAFFFNVFFVRCLGLTALRKNVKNLTNTSVFGDYVGENVANSRDF